MALQTRNSVMALKKETTEGTPIAPTVSGDYVALQDGFTMDPSFATLENANLTGSIGKSKTVLGLEEPTASFDHYVRGSGVEGTAPNFGPLMENVFGSEAERVTERDTVAASTVSVLKVDAGEGVEFSRGDAVLVKHPAAGFEVRNVFSVATDDLTLAQDLNLAPGTGVNLGKNVKYSPVDSGHPTHSVWLYRGNNAAGAVELMAGSRVTEMSIDVTAGEFVNGSYTLEGNEYFYDPVEITATDVSFDFNDGSPRAGLITAKMYKDPYEVAAAVETTMNLLSADTITVVYDDTTGTYTVTSDGATLELLPATGAGTANEGWSSLGFGTSDLTGALTYTAATALDKSSPQTATFDDADPLVAKSNQLMIGPDGQDIACFEASTVSMTLSNTKADILSVCADSGKSGSIITEREATIEVTALLKDHQAEEFKNFRSGDNMLFTFNFGEKSGGNWVPGKTMNVHSPTCTITSFSLGDVDGLVTLDMTLTTYVNSGLGEFYINQL